MNGCVSLSMYSNKILADLAIRNAIEYLTRVGQICTSQRQEFILLSDVLGVSTLVNAMNHPVPPDSKATEATVLGPFFVEESQDVISIHLEKQIDAKDLRLSRFLSVAPSPLQAKESQCL